MKLVEVHVQKCHLAEGPGNHPVPYEVALRLIAPDGTEKVLWLERTVACDHVFQEWRPAGDSSLVARAGSNVPSSVTGWGRLWAQHWSGVWGVPVEMPPWRHETTEPGQEG